MKTKRATKAKPQRTDDLLPEYRFDYSKAKPNRFAAKTQPRTVAVLLDPDVAKVFDAKSVNDVLRGLISTMPGRRRVQNQERGVAAPRSTRL